ncbi:MAG: arsenate reductase ArsC [Candidatus Dadabacteria bacterium]|nr:arsenate reductase ArsC [Candidatus Dadabacteria bacterium]MYE60709.1 arsenate reductase ArsC [Candidatus Dadabacteria bacterium]MYI73519.1 arsenate reductase ArsC [Candidatus Dadabacteria bacterium]
MQKRIYRVLFLCTGNSIRSIIAESPLNYDSDGKFVGYSAGSHPRGEVHPQALNLLCGKGHAIENLRSKSWDEFKVEDVPSMDFILTVCDNAANEPCPVWPSMPVTAHWGLADPAGVEGTETEQLKAFEKAYDLLKEPIAAFLALPFDSLDSVELRERLEKIGRRGSGTDGEENSY